MVKGYGASYHIINRLRHKDLQKGENGGDFQVFEKYLLRPGHPAYQSKFGQCLHSFCFLTCLLTWVWIDYAILLLLTFHCCTFILSNVLIKCNWKQKNRLNMTIFTSWLNCGYYTMVVIIQNLKSVNKFKRISNHNHSKISKDIRTYLKNKRMIFF